MRVLGLDITEQGVFAVEMDTAFGRFEIRDTHRANTANEILNSLSRKTDRLIIDFPVTASTFRNLQIASKDRKAIKAALEFELEDDLPFDKESLHYDSVAMAAAAGSAATGSASHSSMIHVCATQKQRFSAYIEPLIEQGINPDVVTSDAWAYRCLFSRLLAETPTTDSILLMGISQTKTFFYIHQENRPILYREIPYGLAQGAGDMSQAALDVLLPELKQTELSARSTLKGSIDRIFMTGEAAIIPGMIEWLSEATQKNILLFRPLSQLSETKNSYSDLSEVQFAKALALSMVAIPADKLPAINLRKGTFAKSKGQEASPLDFFVKILPYAALVFAVFLSTKMVELQFYKGKLETTEEILKKSVKNYMGGSIADSAVRTYLADLPKLKKSIQTDLSKERELSKLFSQNPNSPIDFLKSISSKIGKDIVLDAIQFNAGSETTESYKDDRPIKASLTVLISNPQLIAKLSELLEKAYQLKKSTSDEIVQEGHKLYKIVYSGIIAVGKAGK